VSRPPLEDPSYEPKYPPVDGKIPAEVSKFGPETQLRWFKRFSGDLDQGYNYYDYYTISEHHRGPCCGSCVVEYEENQGTNYGSVIDDGWCCCRDGRISE
jgi:hypothetical protein